MSHDDFEAWVVERVQTCPRRECNPDDHEFDKAFWRWRWDLDFLALARFWGRRKSKDPSTKVGAVLVDPDGVPVALGYNGFPRGVEDTPERYADRDVKYPLVVHAEINALNFAERRPVGSTLYAWPFFTCHDCAKTAVQRGVHRVVTPPPVRDRWGSHYEWARLIYDEAGVEVAFYPAHAIEGRVI